MTFSLCGPNAAMLSNSVIFVSDRQETEVNPLAVGTDSEPEEPVGGGKGAFQGAGVSLDGNCKST